jgi:death-on-curing protein
MVHKAAALLWSIVKNHPFTDGNKRMGLVAIHIFLLMNGYAFYRSRDDPVCCSIPLATELEHPVQLDNPILCLP